MASSTFAAPRRRARIGAACMLAWVALTACASPDGGDPNLVGCLVDTEHQVADPDTRPPGFTLSPAEARARALGLATGALDRHDGAHIDLTLAIDAAGAMTLQRRSWQTAPGGWLVETASGLECEDAYALPVIVRVQAPPDLDLTEAATLTVSAGGRAAFDLRVDAAAHPGSAAPPTGDVDEGVTAIDLLLGGRRDDGPWAGEAGFGIERRHGPTGAPDGTVSYTLSPYGAWSAASHQE